MQQVNSSIQSRSLSMYFNCRFNGKIIRFCGDITAFRLFMKKLCAA